MQHPVHLNSTTSRQHQQALEYLFGKITQDKGKVVHISHAVTSGSYSTVVVWEDTPHPAIPSPTATPSLKDQLTPRKTP